MPIPSRVLLVLLSLLAAVGWVGCLPLRPFSSVVRELGPAAFVEIDGVRVHVVDEGNGEPVLLVHGFGGSTYQFRELQPRLARDFRTLAVDLYGFGYTERPQDLSRYRREGQVDLLARLLDRKGLGSAHLVGHSYGGALALTFAHQRPERVRSLVLLDSASPTYPDDRRRWLAGIPGAGMVFVRGLAVRPSFVRRGLHGALARDEVVTDAVVDEYLDRLAVEGTVRAYLGLTAPTRGDGEKAPVPPEEIAVPTLVLWGAEDPVIDVEDGREATARIPQSRFVTLDGVGHSPAEEDPERVAELVRAFFTDPRLDGLPAARSAERGG